MNTQEIKEQFEFLTGKKISDDEGSPMTTAQFLQQINQGQIRFVELTDCLVGVSYLNTASGTAEYTLPNTVMRIMRVTWDGDKIYPTTIDELDAMGEDWVDDGGTPTDYYVRRLNETKVMGLYPHPHSVKQLRTTFTKIPVTINALDTSTTPEIPAEYHQALVHFACALFYIGQQESIEIRNRAAGHWDLFSQLVASAKKSLTSDIKDRIIVWSGDGLTFSGFIGDNAVGSNFHRSDY